MRYKKILITPLIALSDAQLDEGGNTHFTGCTTASGNNDGHPVKLSLHPVIL